MIHDTNFIISIFDYLSPEIQCACDRCGVRESLRVPPEIFEDHYLRVCEDCYTRLAQIMMQWDI